MKRSSQLVASILNDLSSFIKAGITAEDIDNYCEEKMKNNNAISGAKGYKGFPKSVCVSVNNKVCHGVPTKHEILKEGDLVSVDCCLKLDGHFGDSCRTYIIGKYKNVRDKILLNTCYESMWNAIFAVRDGTSIDFLGKRMDNTAKKLGFQTVKEFAGHGIGRKLHEDPQIPFFPSGSNQSIKEGMFITIEPMLTSGSSKISILSDGWTAVTCDGSKSAQFEHTIFVKKNGCEILSYNDFDKIMGKPSETISNFIE